MRYLVVIEEGPHANLTIDVFGWLEWIYSELSFLINIFYDLIH